MRRLTSCILHDTPVNTSSKKFASSATPVDSRPLYKHFTPDSSLQISYLPSHRIRESLRLEKTSKIIKSNHQLITTMPATRCPEVPYLHIFFEHLQGWWLNHFPGSLTTLSAKKFFLISNLNLPWCNLRAFPLILSLVIPHPVISTAKSYWRLIDYIWTC